MPYKPLDDWTYADVDQALTTLATAAIGTDAYAANYAYAELQDHWQNGTPWMGPDGGDAAVRSTVLAAVQRQFTPVDVIGEVLDRVANALVKHQPSVTLEPKGALAPEPQAGAPQPRSPEVERVQRALAAWWDDVRLWERTREAVRRARWSTRGVLRLWLPPAMLDVIPEGRPNAGQRALPTGLAFEDALARIQLAAPAPDEAGVYLDPRTQERAGLVLQSDADGRPFAEIWRVDPAARETRVRVQWADDAGVVEDYVLPFRGMLPVAEMAAPLLITEPVRRQQARINFFESLLVRVGETAGFPERYTLNAQPEGLWAKTPPADGSLARQSKVINGETWYLYALPRTLGASITTELVGIDYVTNADGSRALAQPGVVFKDPTDPTSAITPAQYARAALLRTCHQGHVLVNTVANASGNTLAQERGDFEDDLTNTKAPLEGMLRALLTTAIVMAEAMGPTPDRSILDQYRLVVDLHVDPGPVSEAEQTAIGGLVTSAVLSRETGLARLGVDDPQAELDRLNADPMAILVRREKQAQVVAAFYTAGATMEAAGKLAGLTDAEIQILVASQRDVTPPPFGATAPQPPAPTGNGGPPPARAGAGAP